MAKKTIVAILLFLCVTLHAVAQERFSRGFSNDSFVPKGQWVTGVSVGFSQSNQNNYQFFILEGINGDTYSFKVTPMFCFIFKDDLGVGGKFGYERSRIKVDEANLVLDSNTNVDFESLYSINQEYSATGIFRNYIGMGRSNRPHARQSGNDSRHILRLDVRIRRHRLGFLRLARRRDEHRIYFQGKHMATIVWHSSHIPA